MSQLPKSQSVKINLEELWAAVEELQKNVKASNGDTILPVLREVKSLVNNLAGRVATLEAEDLTVPNAADVEARLKTLEAIIWGEDGNNA